MGRFVSATGQFLLATYEQFLMSAHGQFQLSIDNLADMGWVAVRTDRQVLVGNSWPGLIPSGGRPR